MGRKSYEFTDIALRIVAFRNGTATVSSYLLVFLARRYARPWMIEVQRTTSTV